jgi:ankyrin repeat protein
MILKKLFFFCTCLVLIVGCDTNSTKEHIIYANDFDVFKNTPVQKLSIAVENQDIQEIQKILNTKKINVDYQESRYGQTLLMLAAYHGLEKSVKELLKNGANPDLLDKEGVDNAFFISCEKNLYRCNTNIVKLMLANGAEINRIRKIGDKSSSTDSYVRTTPLMIAAADNCIETVRLLVQSGAKIDQYTYFEVSNN